MMVLWVDRTAAQELKPASLPANSVRKLLVTAQPDTVDKSQDGWQSPADQPRRRVLPHRIGFGKRARDSTRQVFIATSRMRHQFAEFYSNPTGEWAVLSTTWGDLENEIRWRWVACPAFDSASFKNDFPYWHDRYRVAYACLFCYRQRVDLLPGTDPTTFRSLGFENLAVDKKHVYVGGYIRSGLAPATLRVYTQGGQRYQNPDGYCGAYLLSGAVGYTPYERLNGTAALHFRPPNGYMLVYPAALPRPASTSPSRHK